MEEKNVFVGKTQEEAIQNGLMALTLSRDEAKITVIEEGKKRLFGSTKWRVLVEKKSSDSERAIEFINGLLKIINVEGESSVVSEDEESIKISITTKSSARVIGKRGDVLDAIQCIAGAIANIGREDYTKVVVDCENYRAQREETLVNLAHKIAEKAIETGRKVTLEPMNPYERRIIHSTLVENPDVKTISEGKEPVRYIVVIPSNAKPGDKGIRYGERPDRRDRRDRGDRRDRREKPYGRDDKREDRRGGRRDDRRGGRSSGGAKRGKKEIIFGTYLGNSGAGKTEDSATPAEPVETKTEE